MLDSPGVASAGGVIGYGARAQSMGECCAGDPFLDPSEFKCPSILFGTEISAILNSEVISPDSDVGPCVESTGDGFAFCVRFSFSFFLYRSLSFRARSRSLFNPKIIALCLSTKRHNCEFCAVCDCFSLIKYCIAASGDPAA